MATDVRIDHELLEEAKRLTGLSDERAVLEEALRTLIRAKRQSHLLELRGKVTWEGDLDEIRRGAVVR